jgi:uncharacterized protein (TIGR02266 family)
MGEPQREYLNLTAAALKVKYKYSSTDEFIRQSSNDISFFGIFVKTKTPLNEGVPLKLDLQLKDGSPVIRGLGQVVWRREVAQSEGYPAGMGIKFIKLDEASRQIVEQAVEARGLGPSRFDKPVDQEAQVAEESEGPVFERTKTLSGIGTLGPLSFDALASLSPSSEAPLDASVPPRHSFTRQRSLAISESAEQEQDWRSRERPEDQAARAAYTPNHLSQPPNAEHTDVTAEVPSPRIITEWPPRIGGSRARSAALQAAQLSNSQPNVDGTDRSSFAQSRSIATDASNTDEPPETIARRDPRGIDVPPQSEAEPPDLSEMPAWPESAKISEDIGRPWFTSKAPSDSEESPQDDARFLQEINSAFDSVISINPSNERAPSSERSKDSVFRERLTERAADDRTSTSRERESALRVARLAELSRAEVYQYSNLREQWAFKIASIEKRFSQAIGRGARPAADAHRRTVGADGARAIQRRRRVLTLSLALLLAIIGGVTAGVGLGPKAWEVYRVWSGKLRQIQKQTIIEPARRPEKQETPRGAIYPK